MKTPVSSPAAPASLGAASSVSMAALSDIAGGFGGRFGGVAGSFTRVVRDGEAFDCEAWLELSDSL